MHDSKFLLEGSLTDRALVLCLVTLLCGLHRAMPRWLATRGLPVLVRWPIQNQAVLVRQLSLRSDFSFLARSICDSDHTNASGFPGNVAGKLGDARGKSGLHPLPDLCRLPVAPGSFVEQGTHR